MDERELQRRLGLAPDETLKALVALAERTSPDHPSDAFEALWLNMPWLEQGQGGGQGTPQKVHPFASTGGNLNHFGFLMEGDLPTDERPIVMVVPKGRHQDTNVVAPNLREFLGLIAIAFGEVVSRNATDQAWFGFREAWYAGDPERLAEMQRLSDLLCSIPGVRRPESPSRVANAHPSVTFTVAFDDAAGQQFFVPKRASLRNLALQGFGIGGAAAAVLHLAKGIPVHWCAAAIPVGVGSLVLPHLWGYDTMVLGHDGFSVQRRGRERQMAFNDISRIYKFQERTIAPS